MKSSELITFNTNTSLPPIHNNRTPIEAPIISVIGVVINLSLALLNISL